MNTREVLAIAIKLFSIWVLVQTFWLSPSLVLLLGSVESFKGIIYSKWIYAAIISTFILVGFVISIVLYKVSNSILTSNFSENELDVSDHSKNFLLQLGGIYFVVTTLVYFPASIGFLWSLRPEQEGIPFHYFLRPFGYLIQLFIGLWLILHPSWWSFMLNKFRGRA